MNEAQKLIEQLRHKVRDYSDNPKAPQAVRLHSMLDALLHDVKGGAGRERLIHRVEELEDFFDSLRNTEGVISPGDIDDLRDRGQELEKLIRGMRA